MIDSFTKAEAFATGIAGGASGDRIETIPSGSIALTSKAVTEATTVSVAILGNAAADAHALAIANVTGLDGGDGTDVLEVAAQSTVR